MKYISLQENGIFKEDYLMKIIATNNAPAAIGPYSQGIVSGSFAYCSGQIPVNPADGTIPEGIEAQAHQSCKNCFLADMADFATFNSVYAQYFTSNPARSCCAVKALPKGVLCEIEAVAEV